MSILRGFPPKVIWIRRGNCSTNQIEDILRSHFEDIQAFEKTKIGSFDTVLDLQSVNLSVILGMGSGEAIAIISECL